MWVFRWTGALINFILDILCLILKLRPYQQMYQIRNLYFFLFFFVMVSQFSVRTYHVEYRTFCFLKFTLNQQINYVRSIYFCILASFFVLCSDFGHIVTIFEVLCVDFNAFKRLKCLFYKAYHRYKICRCNLGFDDKYLVRYFLLIGILIS